eukprot:5836810-Amphidinium_carterae.1
MPCPSINLLPQIFPSLARRSPCGTKPEGAMCSITHLCIQHVLFRCILSKQSRACKAEGLVTAISVSTMQLFQQFGLPTEVTACLVVLVIQCNGPLGRI